MLRKGSGTPAPDILTTAAPGPPTTHAASRRGGPGRRHPVISGGFHVESERHTRRPEAGAGPVPRGSRSGSSRNCGGIPARTPTSTRCPTRTWTWPRTCGATATDAVEVTPDGPGHRRPPAAAGGPEARLGDGLGLVRHDLAGDEAAIERRMIEANLNRRQLDVLDRVRLATEDAGDQGEAEARRPVPVRRAGPARPGRRDAGHVGPERPAVLEHPERPDGGPAGLLGGQALDEAGREGGPAGGGRRRTRSPGRSAPAATPPRSSPRTCPRPPPPRSTRTGNTSGSWRPRPTPSRPSTAGWSGSAAAWTSTRRSRR